VSLAANIESTQNVVSNNQPVNSPSSTNHQFIK